jgi:hypothetical protein
MIFLSSMSFRWVILAVLAGFFGLEAQAISPECKRTLILGDSQMAYGVTPFKMTKTFDQEEFSTFSSPAFGTWLFRYFAGEDCASSIFVYSQGGSGVFDWLGEAQIDGKPFPDVRFLGGSRMILQPGFSWMTDYSSRLSSREREWYRLPSLKEIVSPSNWVLPERVIIALSANDWWVGEADLVQKYRELLAVARGGELKRECVLVGVVGVDSQNSRSLRRKEDAPSVTDENVRKLVRMGKTAAEAEGCGFIDLTPVKPSEPDGLHIGGKSALEAYLHFRSQYRALNPGL